MEDETRGPKNKTALGGAVDRTVSSDSSRHPRGKRVQRQRRFMADAVSFMASGMVQRRLGVNREVAG
jgi:hypothetical protein